LTSNEIFSLIYTNAIINDDVTSLFFEPSELTIYYLGGGDPGDNIEEIEKVVQKTHQFYYGDQVLPFVEWIRDNHQRANGNQSGYPFEQIVSTIGLDNGSLDRLIDLARTIPELNIQISVNAFDEQARACTISNLEKVMSIERCVRAAEKFYGVTSATENPRRAFLSIFLLQDVYDDLDKIMDDIERLKIDKTRVHITLDVLRHPPQFIHQPASIGRYKALHRKLRREGYSASIYYPPEDSTTEEGCGIISTHLLERVYGNAEIN
jgi:adenine C2-methylase RlmN of 23S rRNA A2503 and tRNA A37